MDNQCIILAIILSFFTFAISALIFYTNNKCKQIKHKKIEDEEIEILSKEAQDLDKGFED
jgi:phosphotransferase system  glucose/maltose/N-acetylglucosamine-specific IIC component